MKIVSEISLDNFEAWSGGRSTLSRVINEGKCDELEAMLEELYPDGMTDTQLNDLLWFEPDTVFEWVGIRSESKIRSELEEAKEELEEVMEELEELKEEFEDAVTDEAEEINSNREIAGMNELDDEEMEKLRSKIWEDYTDDAAELREKISTLEEEISELEEELENI